MPTPEARRHRQQVLLFAVVALVFTLVANAAVGVLLIVTRAQTEEYARCAAQWQQQFSVAYLARSDAAADVSQAMDAVVHSVSVDDREAFRVAVRNYVALRDNQEKERRENPLPPLPETLCGTIGDAGP